MKYSLVLLLVVLSQINCFSKNDFEDVMYGVAKGFDVTFGAEKCVFYS
jgi:hypothetical protein